jgi:hypothetical protein
MGVSRDEHMRPHSSTFAGAVRTFARPRARIPASDAFVTFLSFCFVAGKRAYFC